MKPAVAIFVKTPQLSPVKTRLAATIGKEKAEEFYTLSISALKSLAKEAQLHFDFYWAVAEPEGLHHTFWSGLRTISQGQGGLGDRLHHVYDMLRKDHSTVLFLGGDAPQVTAKHLQLAVNLTKDHGYVFGPASDGGFYLFSGNRPIHKNIWTSVEYSQDTTLRDLNTKLKGYCDLPMLRDVDQETDFESLQNELEVTDKNGEQQKLLTWLDAHILLRELSTAART